ncbi:MAG: PqqD family protein [Candidatus Rokubacteria bacterium]|nr:PqqD family protein [Candidatus Rokubacteria bacterium]
MGPAEDAITLGSHVRIREDVVFRELQGEMVLLNLKTGVYFGLDPVGTRIWHLMQEPRSLQEILDALVGEYEVARARCQADLLTFVTRLREKELIEVSR